MLQTVYLCLPGALTFSRRQLRMEVSSLMPVIYWLVGNSCGKALAWADNIGWKGSLFTEGGGKKERMEANLCPDVNKDKQKEKVWMKERGAWWVKDLGSEGWLWQITMGKHTVSTEALGEGGGVRNVVGRVLLWHQGDHWAVCYLHTKTQKLCEIILAANWLFACVYCLCSACVTFVFTW